MSIQEIQNQLRQLSRSQMDAEQHNASLLELASGLTSLESDWRTQRRSCRLICLSSLALALITALLMLWQTMKVRHLQAQANQFQAQLTKTQTKLQRQQQRLDADEENLLMMAKLIASKPKK